MRISPERIKELQRLLKQHHGVEYSDEEAQQAGIAIIRFAVAKKQRELELANQKGNRYEKLSSGKSLPKSQI